MVKYENKLCLAPCLEHPAKSVKLALLEKGPKKVTEIGGEVARLGFDLVTCVGCKTLLGRRIATVSKAVATKKMCC